VVRNTVDTLVWGHGLHIYRRSCHRMQLRLATGIGVWVSSSSVIWPLSGRRIVVRIFAEAYRRRRPARKAVAHWLRPLSSNGSRNCSSIGCDTRNTPESIPFVARDLPAPLGGVQGSPGRIRPARLAEVATPQQDRGRANPVLDQAPLVVVCQRWGNLPQGLSACSNHQPI
jgi:hypothetical protein